ncbi:MAG: hypothetical protein KGH67_05605 [Candidatus Micrarchaeota archaeon]|nr:hypothetical protein [Candidatus Micrarchaeota archaeon]MDE1859971.1 hypothetical protein [Candidatus Micrarchaeota archaeon]
MAESSAKIQRSRKEAVNEAVFVILAEARRDARKSVKGLRSEFRSQMRHAFWEFEKKNANSGGLLVAILGLATYPVSEIVIAARAEIKILKLKRQVMVPTYSKVSKIYEQEGMLKDALPFAKGAGDAGSIYRLDKEIRLRKDAAFKERKHARMSEEAMRIYEQARQTD